MNIEFALESIKMCVNFYGTETKLIFKANQSLKFDDEMFKYLLSKWVSGKKRIFNEIYVSRFVLRKQRVFVI